MLALAKRDDVSNARQLPGTGARNAARGQSDDRCEAASIKLLYQFSHTPGVVVLQDLVPAIMFPWNRLSVINLIARRASLQGL